MKKLLLLLLPLSIFSQNSYIVVEAQYDSFGPAESEFYITDDNGDTILHHVPTAQFEYYIDTIWTNAGSHSVIMLDSYGDGWQSTSMAGSFRAWNDCQDTIVEFLCNPSNGFATEIINFNLGPCQPNPPPPPVPCVPAKVIINLDQYQSETSWEITDTNGIVYASGSGYGANPDYATVIVPVCIPVGELNFTIFDSYGDGLNGSIWQGQDGSYYVKQCNDTLVYGNDPAFGNDSTHVFASDSCPPILGCTDNDYVEWNPFADLDDGSCQTLKVFGCLDTTMFNYDPSANTMELIDTCVYTLILHDLMGNGWVGSNLELVHPDTSYNFTHNGTFNDIHYVGLTAPDPIRFIFSIDPLAQLTTIECGFTLINPEGDTMISIQPPFIQPLLPYFLITNCGNTCEEKVFGCLDDIALNYNVLANTTDSSCYYVAGCTSPTYIEYNALADYDDGSCDVPVVLGCMDSTAFNYNPLANTELAGSCIAIVTGCMQPLAFNYNPNANVADTCIALAYGCTDPTMFNYDQLANTDDGGCEPFVYGCTDSTAFNYNPLANADNNSCVPYIYGCTDPSMLNYNSSANTEDFSCIAYVYGCMDSLALNYNPLANTDNSSCIEVVVGCMDPGAYSYEPSANVSDSLSCLYNAGCITGPGNPYWLNDPCYAWVLSVDDYCCENEWDEICQLTYNYCDGTWSGPLIKRVDKKELVMITDLLGRPTKETNNKLLLYIYDDGSVTKKLIKQK